MLLMLNTSITRRTLVKHLNNNLDIITGTVTLLQYQYFIINKH